jgi:prepilin-type N-terminal cleavage/methylation domain-containing protein
MRVAAPDARPGRRLLSRAMRRANEEGGLTLIEMLVVIAIVGILAAIAIATFTNQRTKATDAKAKSNLTTAQRAMEAYFVDKGTYEGSNTSPPPDPNSLLTIEPTLIDPPVPTITARGERTYRMEVASTSGIFEVRRLANGETDRTCAPEGVGGCSATGQW